MNNGIDSRKTDLVNRKRRSLLLGAGALLLQEKQGAGMRRIAAQAGGRVRLDTYGGRPGAAPSALKKAFKQALSTLQEAGGGILLVPPGVYDFGNYSTEQNIVSVDDASHVAISAYGATFRINTTARVVPCMFYFANPNKVSVAGASFQDLGYQPRHEWQGMYCVRAEASRECGGFNMIDCTVNGAVGLFQSQQYGANKYLIRDISIQGTSRNTYYGVALTYVGDNARVDLVCENVRRGCIAFGLRNAQIDIRMTHSATAPGSNGFISLISEGESAGNVENVRIVLEASGVARHAALVHFYHQQNEARGYMRNIDARVTVNDLKQDGGTSTNIFTFDHELPGSTIKDRTARGWDRISLSGRVAGRVSGHIIHNPSVSTSPGTIYISSRFAEQEDMSRLPGYFHIRPS